MRRKLFILCLALSLCCTCVACNKPNALQRNNLNNMISNW